MHHGLKDAHDGLADVVLQVVLEVDRQVVLQRKDRVLRLLECLGSLGSLQTRPTPSCPDRPAAWIVPHHCRRLWVHPFSCSSCGGSVDKASRRGGQRARMWVHGTLMMTYGTRSPMLGAVAGSRLRIFLASSTCAALAS